MQLTTRRDRTAYIGTGMLQAFIGLGAIGGGLMLIMDPSGNAMGLPVDMLQGFPFPDFLIPGLFLFTVNGLGSMVGAGLSLARSRYAPEAAVLLGAILVAWILIQLAIIKSVHWLHILYFVLGFVELTLGLRLRRRRNSAAF